jgi:hypothetical protein
MYMRERERERERERKIYVYIILSWSRKQYQSMLARVVCSPLQFSRQILLENVFEYVMYSSK